jgi:N6-adenosine-specific RNA methylase IME4
MSNKKEKHQVAIVDPPWPQKKGGRRKVRPVQGRSFDYITMGVQEIEYFLSTIIIPAMADTHTLFVWTIEKFLTECDQMMAGLGYRRHVRLVWDKGNGPTPAYTVRYSHEYLVWYYRPKMIPINRKMRGKALSVFSSPGRQHSRKPDVAYDLVASLYPKCRKIDIFSREKREGWDQLGDECNYFGAMKQ